MMGAPLKPNWFTGVTRAKIRCPTVRVPNCALYTAAATTFGAEAASANPSGPRGCQNVLLKLRPGGSGGENATETKSPAVPVKLSTVRPVVCDTVKFVVLTSGTTFVVGGSFSIPCPTFWREVLQRTNIC